MAAAGGAGERLGRPVWEGGRLNPPLQEEPESIVGYIIDRAIRETPGEAGRLLLQLMREKAQLEGELRLIKARLREVLGI